MFLFLIVFLVYLIYLLYFLFRKLIRNFRLYNIENNPVSSTLKIILPNDLEKIKSNNFDSTNVKIE